MTYMPKQRANKRAIGSYYEQVAKVYLEQQGYHILATNFRCKLGEIDLIAQQDAYIIFVEVKYRRTLAFGYPREAVNYTKQQHILRTAQYYLITKVGYEAPCRFDVIEVLDEKVTHLKAAF